ncbi:MAG: hypothetical protein ACPLN0_06740 [Candidatus Hydrothermia bacterium]
MLSGKNIYSVSRALIFSLLFLISCASIKTSPGRQILRITPISCELASIELNKIDMLFKIMLKNNTSGDIQINSMNYEFYINNQLASGGKFIENPVRIRARSSRNLEKFIPVPEEQQTPEVKVALKERKGTYKLILTYTLDGGQTTATTLLLPIKQMY